MMFSRVIVLLSVALISKLAFGVTALDELTDIVQRDIARSEQQQKERLQRFESDLLQQDAKLAHMAEKIALAQQRATQLNEQLEAQGLQKIERSEQLQREDEELKTMLQSAKSLTQEVADQLSEDGYLAGLAFAQEDGVPSLQNLQQLWLVMLQGIASNAQVKRVDAQVIDLNGVIQRSPIVRVGPFVALDQDGRYLNYLAQREAYQVIGALASLNAQGKMYVQGNSDQLQVDPSAGELLLQMSQKPTLLARIHQGGEVGYIIISLGVLGLLLALWRISYMQLLKWRISRQLKSEAPSKSNPVGRLLSELNDAKDLTDISIKVDELILSELPVLERSQSAIKLFAAVAPLLGLLGTVTGMIATFQSITTLGVSDPKLMAAGISQALVTTVLGLCVAIPLLFVHSYLSGSSKRIIQQLQHSGLLFQIGLERQQQKNSDEVPLQRANTAVNLKVAEA